MGWKLPEGHTGYTSPSCGRSWNPSEDIADAWEVVERMRELGWNLSMWNTHDGGWYCETETKIGAREFAESPTAPLAICCAALKAVGA